MSELYNIRNQLINELKKLLRSKSDLVAFLLRELKYFPRTGDEIQGQYCQAQSNDDSLRNLFEACRIVPKGLVCLREILLQESNQESKGKIRTLFSEYAHLDDHMLEDDCRELTSYTFSCNPEPRPELDFVDRYNMAELEKARRMLLNVSQKGELCDVDSSRWSLPITESSAQAFRDLLKEALSRRSPAGTEEFRQKMTNVTANPQVFLLIVVEKTWDGKYPYQFRHEILEESVQEPAQLKDQRADQGEYPTGSMESFASIISPWINMAQQIYSNLRVEIFLPDELLISTEGIHIDISAGDKISKVPLWSSGAPTVIRPVRRIKRRISNHDEPRQRGLHSRFSEKWSTFGYGNGFMHPVCNLQQVELQFLRPRLSQSKLVGAFMLIDLPLSLDDRQLLFAEVIESGLSFFAWWMPRAGQHHSTDANPANITARRLKNIVDLFEINGLPEISESDFADPDFELDDVQAPIHLHAMESVAEKLRSCAAKPSKKWVHDLLVMVDHPERWPQLVFYEDQLGGGLRSPL
jgi:hypothetical protein